MVNGEINNKNTMEQSEEVEAFKRKHTSESQIEVDAVNLIEGQIKTNSVEKESTNIQGHEIRKVMVPTHRYTPLKENWLKIVRSISEELKLLVRFNLKTKCIELKTGLNAEDFASLQKGEDFLKAFIYGFEVEDALALIRLNDLFIETFEIHDVKTLKGDHLKRAIGRLAGKDGRMKFTIENATETRIVLSDTKIHILGSYQNIQLARRFICNLILGTPPSKVFGKLKNIANRF